MLLGCIGDDFTGSSDLGNVLKREGMHVVQYCGTPAGAARKEVEAGVVALKSRSIAPDDAVRLSLEALEWLIAQHCEQFFFKYCSTFDSTRTGNIGPVADALIERLGADRVIVCPAFPGTGRTLYQGHLFVGDVLLSQSSMRTHPLTPMTDADIRRWLGHQTGHSVGHVPWQVVSEGAEAVRKALDQQVENKLVVVDAVSDADLRQIGRAANGLKLVTGGSGVAQGLPATFAGRLTGDRGEGWCGAPGPAAILAGSCSRATLGQIERFRADHPAMKIKTDRLMAGELTVDHVFTWATDHLEEVPLICLGQSGKSQGSTDEIRFESRCISDRATIWRTGAASR